MQLLAALRFTFYVFVSRFVFCTAALTFYVLRFTVYPRAAPDRAGPADQLWGIVLVHRCRGPAPQPAPGVARFLDARQGEAQAVARQELRRERQVGADHHAGDRVAAGGLRVGHEQDGRAVGRHLYDARQHTERRQADRPGVGQPRALQTVAHAVRVAADLERLCQQQLQRIGRKEVGVRAADEPQLGLGAVGRPRALGPAPARWPADILERGADAH